MTFGDWVTETTARVRRDGAGAVKPAVSDLYSGAWGRVGRVYNYGTPIWERNWDLLIILDACRVDLLEEVASEYEFIGDISTLDSVGSMSKEWLEKTFAKQYHAEMKHTAYITGNPFTALCDADLNVLDNLDEVWAYAWDPVGTIKPRPLTDRTIAAARTSSHERTIVHYMQPHEPFLDDLDIGSGLGTPGESFGKPSARKTVWEQIRDGELDRSTVWEAYRRNLRHVLDDVELLLSNVDAEKVVITADHANAIGEYGIWGHPAFVPHKSVKRVPWVVTTATDSESHTPESWERNVSDGKELKDRLGDLGYL